MSKTYTINIYSNNGQTTLASYSLEDSFKMTIYITEKGIEQDGAKLPSILYSYDGKNIFEGVALTANNKTADYSVKSDFTVSDSDVNLYVVENSGAKAALYLVYIDGVRVSETINSVPYEISSTGLLVSGSQVWTYSGAETFLGFSFTSGSTVPDTHLFVGDSGDLATYVGASEFIYLYSVAGSSPTSNDYTITQTLTNITSDSATITITPDTGYTLPSSITVSGATLTSYNSSTGVAVLSNMTNSVSVEAECSGGSVTLIEFTISNTSFQAEDGMTWTEWCNSAYNTSGLYVSGGEVQIDTGLKVGVVNCAPVSASAEIIANFAYVLYNPSACD